MTLRYAARKDRNQDEIVKGLRALGVKVHILSQKDIPDLLIGHGYRLFLFEIKDGAKKPSERRLRPGQQAFANEWAGYPISKIESLEDAITALGLESRKARKEKQN